MEQVNSVNLEGKSKIFHINEGKEKSNTRVINSQRPDVEPAKQPDLTENIKSEKIH